MNQEDVEKIKIYGMKNNVTMSHNNIFKERKNQKQFKHHRQHVGTSRRVWFCSLMLLRSREPHKHKPILRRSLFGGWAPSPQLFLRYVCWLQRLQETPPNTLPSVQKFHSCRQDEALFWWMLVRERLVDFRGLSKHLRIERISDEPQLATFFSLFCCYLVGLVRQLCNTVWLWEVSSGKVEFGNRQLFGAVFLHLLTIWPGTGAVDFSGWERKYPQFRFCDRWG